MIESFIHRLVLLDLLSVAVLIHTVEEDGAFAMPAAGLGKRCPSASLVISWRFFGASWRLVAVS